MARHLTCPSAQPDQKDSAIIGVVRWEDNEPLVETLPEAISVDRLIHLVPAEVPPTEVLRFAAPCAEEKCAHFDDNQCQLAKRIVTSLPATIERLKPCAIRRSCRWFQQEGSAACRRCPQVVTEPFTGSAVMVDVSRPVPKRKGSNHNG